ncbi:hypothetical protein B7463_g1157, partial [Scytalidium lignicola]
MSKKDREGVIFDEMTTSINNTHNESHDEENVSKTEELILRKAPNSKDPEVQEVGKEHPCILDTTQDIVTTVIHVDDDPTLNPWTFRLSLSTFASVLQEVFYFRAVTVFVSAMFLTVLAHFLGKAMATLIPRCGLIGHFLNPGPWNRKEHTAAVLMASAAAVSALATEALAVQKLFYRGNPTQAAGILITISSQLIGYGVAGMLRKALLWPTKMFYPANLPITTVFETLHRPWTETRKRFGMFWIVFVALFCWEWFPEYIFPLLGGVSVFCLAKQRNLVFTNLFGGAQANEGLGFLSISFDWSYIAGSGSPLWIPFQTLVNSFIGYLGCVMLFMGIYYNNIWRSQDFPFLSPQLFNTSSNFTNYVLYNESLILNSEFRIDETLVDAVGLPWLTGTYVSYLITTSAGFTATFVHMFLWNYNDIKLGWAWITLDTFKKSMTSSTYFFWKGYRGRTKEEKEKIRNDPNIDPHYKLTLDYNEVPNFWYFCIFAVSWIVGIIFTHNIKSTLPWWGFLIGTILNVVSIIIFGAQYATTGFGFNMQPVFQMLAGYNALTQGLYLLRDLKLAQQNKLSPKCAFATQVIGCIYGAVLNYVIMNIVVKNQAHILVSVEGTNIWSGTNVQQFNTLAIAWSIAPNMFSLGARYSWVTIAYLVGFIIPFPFYFMNRLFENQRIWSYLNSSIILWYLGYLAFGVSSANLSYYLIGAFGQFYLRRYKPKTFVKWNYLFSAAMEGGTQILVFLLTFAVAGGSGTAVPFPAWPGNHINNVDYCMYNPALKNSL